MNPFIPESFLEYVNQISWEVMECGAVSMPIKNFSVSIDAELQLSIVVTSEEPSSNEFENYLPGTVRRLNNFLLFRSKLLAELRVNDYLRTNSLTGNKCVDTFTIDSIELSFIEESIPAYTVEWIENAHDNFHHWPDLVKYDNNFLTIGKGSSQLIVEIPGGNFGNGLAPACMELDIQGVKCYFFHLPNKNKDKKISPGFLLYKGFLQDSLRRKVLIALSFIIGRQLICIGNCDLDINWKPIRFRYQSSSAPTTHALAYVSQPPMNIHSSYKFMDGQLISKLVSKIIGKYDDLKFDRIMWQYWFSRYAPMHIGAVQIGAIIEAVQKIFLDLNENKLKSTIVDKRKFKCEVKPNLTEAIMGLELLEQEKTDLIEKLNELNRLSQKNTSKLFFTHIGINLSALEIQAWQQRNNSAHGNLYEHDQAI